ncbi:MAG TPA: UbiD family decarboxylase [Flavobacteriales bacterium]|nr:UbiD family decarboxylase [Flavobacteriales bacterium]HIN40811.1 UbiD family decarboxylase [Flavobacteriales bacterium]
MGYSSLEQCIQYLENHGHLIRVHEEVDPTLEMAAIHLRVHEAAGPAILFENVKGSKFRAVSNLFGTLERSKVIFRDTLSKVTSLIALKNDPLKALRSPIKNVLALKAFPKKIRHPLAKLTSQCLLRDLPQIKSWPGDGGAYILLPQVYTEDTDKPGVLSSNLGCYRIQISGNDFAKDKEAGLHYQIHRGIGVHHSKTNKKGEPLKVSVFVGGPPAHTLASVMPLPEGLSELTFAGIMNNRRFRYGYENGSCISADADFVITGEIAHNETKLEGPFGDHLGYYSLKHEFPLMKVDKVYHKTNAIWPFTVVGRPPQEDTQFGALIHDITGPIIPAEIPGLQEINAVDAAGVHPLLLAIGSERYTPYLKERRPQEILTISNHILGFGQMSLAKYLIIASKEDNPKLSVNNVAEFFKHCLERVDWTRDLHFQTKTTIDTLDYSGSGLNSGSKLVIAVAGKEIRELKTELDSAFSLPDGFSNPKFVLPGVIAISSNADCPIENLTNHLENVAMDGFPLILVVDDSDFVSRSLNNFLWVTFTKSNPSHDVYGIDSFIENKHWGCNGSLVIDARSKSHHAPPLVKDPEIEKKVDNLGSKGASLHGII